MRLHRQPGVQVIPLLQQFGTSPSYEPCFAGIEPLKMHLLCQRSGCIFENGPGNAGNGMFRNKQTDKASLCSPLLSTSWEGAKSCYCAGTHDRYTQTRSASKGTHQPAAPARGPLLALRAGE